MEPSEILQALEAFRDKVSRFERVDSRLGQLRIEMTEFITRLREQGITAQEQNA